MLEREAMKALLYFLFLAWSFICLFLQPFWATIPHVPKPEELLRFVPLYLEPARLRHREKAQ
jgi:hypothetical protein